MAVEDEVMEGIVSSLESNQKGETLSVEDVVWADSCLVKESEIPDSDWNSIKDALLDILTSEAGLLNSSASVSDDPNVENDIEMPTSTEVEKAELFLRSGAETEASSVRTPIDLLPINEESGTNSENIAIKKYLNDFQSLAFVGNPFLPTYSDGMKESETTELGTDSSSSLYDTEPTTDDIFRVWDLDVPAEEDELAKQLKKALEERASPSLPCIHYQMAFFSSFRRVLGGSSSSSPFLQSHLASIRHSSTLTSPKLFISGLSRLTTNEKLREAFSSFGQIVDAKVIADRVSGRSKGFGFVTYTSIEEAEKAREGMNAKFLDGWVIFVDPAKPREPRPPPQPQSASSETGFTSNKTIGWCG